MERMEGSAVFQSMSGAACIIIGGKIVEKQFILQYVSN